jgi:hypothetical protein
VSLPLGHPQEAFWQVRGASQIEPGHVVPQCDESVVRFTQPAEPPQSVSPGAQPHLPSVHASPALHALSHEPQWAGLVLSFAQTVPHSVVGAPHPQAPPPHGTPAAHALSHEPQLLSLLFVSTQAPLQKISPGGQPHAPC